MKPAGLAVAALVCIGLLNQPADARQRVHYIAADEVTWSYAPQHRNLITGRALRPLLPAQLGWSYHKAIYQEYTDGSFAKLAPIAPAERYRGLVGPTIHAEVGDTIVVIFRNRTRIPVDIAPAGLASSPKPAPVMAGATRSFRWSIGAADGPAMHDTSSILYVYASDVRQSADENLGLIGPLIVTRKGAAREDGFPADVDREVIVLFSTQQEDLNPLLSANLRDRAINPRRITRRAKRFVGANAFPSINGYVYGNMPMTIMHAGERVRWYLLSTQNGLDFHVPTWTGQTVLSQGNRHDSVALSTPHEIVDMVPDDPGIWLLTCSLNVHLERGMEARYEVLAHPDAPKLPRNRVVRGARTGPVARI